MFLSANPCTEVIFGGGDEFIEFIDVVGLHLDFVEEVEVDVLGV